MTDEDRIEKLELTVAHLVRQVEDLSDIIAKRETEIDLLTRRVHMLMEREAQRESEGSGGVLYGDERPPHY